jgi:predicted metalloprotease
VVAGLAFAACGEDDGGGGGGGGPLPAGDVIEPGPSQTTPDEQPPKTISQLIEESRARLGNQPAQPAVFTSQNPPGAPTLEATRQYVAEVVEHADRKWTEWFLSQNAPEPWVKYEIVMPGNPYTSNCTYPGGNVYDSAHPNAYYCEHDLNDHDRGALILPVETMQKMWTGEVLGRRVEPSKRTGDFAAAVIVGHEFGHHVQDELTEVTGAPKPKNPQVELLADCFSGVWAYTVFQEARLEEGDLDEAVAALEAVGDQLGTHGTPAERRTAFQIGFAGTTDIPGGGQPDRCIDNYWITQ